MFSEINIFEFILQNITIHRSFYEFLKKKLVKYDEGVINVTI